MENNKRPKKIIFAGTPAFAVPSLEALIKDSRFTVVAVITQPDMPVGRNKAIIGSPVKQCAVRHNIPILQPSSLKFIIEQIKEYEPEAIVVVAFSQLVPPSVLSIPPFGCVNLHGSLLPKYRGASVVQAPILNGDKETGVTIMVMDEKLDTGPLLSEARYVIKNNETAESLAEELSQLGAEILPDTLDNYLEKKLLPTPQPQDDPSVYVPRLVKADGLIDWNKEAIYLEKFVRGMTPWPSAWTWLKGKQLKILEADNSPLPFNLHKPGKTFLYNSCLAVQCGQDSLLVKKLQLEGKKALTAQEFVRGYNDFIGQTLG